MAIKSDMYKFYTDVLNLTGEHIMHNCTPGIDPDYEWLNKGIIVPGDETFVVQDEDGNTVQTINALDFVKEQLDYDALSKNGKVVELTIDESWSEYMRKTPDDEDGREVWNRLVIGAREANHGLLVLNISNKMVFGHCWKLKKLVKQEKTLELWPGPHDTFEGRETRFNFDGYVLFILNGFSWHDAREYAEHTINGSEFEALRTYCFVPWW